MNHSPDNFQADAGFGQLDKPDQHVQHVHFDQLLDQASSTYTPTEPRPGLELRILNTLRSDSRPERSRLPSPLLKHWGFGAILAVVVIAIGIWMSAHNAPTPSPQLVQAVPRSNPLPAVARTQRTATPSTSHHRHAFRQNVGKQAPVMIVPIPKNNLLQPTSQEILLLQLASKGSGKALLPPLSRHAPITAVTLTTAEDKPIKIQPLSTEAISIAPIRIAALQLAPTPAE